jgi:hypothetical protein
MGIISKNISCFVIASDSAAIAETGRELTYFRYVAPLLSSVIASYLAMNILKTHGYLWVSFLIFDGVIDGFIELCFFLPHQSFKNRSINH